MLTKTEFRELAFWTEGLSETEFERAQRGLIERTYAAGTTICHRGDRFDYWTGVASGLLKISAISKSGKAITFAGVGSGGWFGEGTVLKKEPRKYDLVALRDTRLLMLNPATFDWLFENSVAFNRYLVRATQRAHGAVHCDH